MKINPTAAYQAYNKISEHSHAARRLGAASELPAQKAENTDRIHISPEASRQLEVEQLSRSILSEIREPASQERLGLVLFMSLLGRFNDSAASDLGVAALSLRSAIQKGTYNVPTGELVNAVMRHFVA